MKALISDLYKALVNTINHDGIEHAGYMSFMVLLTLFPFLVFIVALSGFFGASDIGKRGINLLLTNMPSSATEGISSRIEEILNSPPQSLMTLAIIGTIWTSSSFMEGLRTILNRIYEIVSPPSFLWRRFLSIVYFLALSMFLIIVVLILVITPIFISKFDLFNEIIIKIDPFWTYARYLLLLTSLLFIVSMLYFVIPNLKLRYKNVIPGSILTVILWSCSGYLMSVYLSYYNQFNLIYGSLGKVIITLLFFFIVNMIFIYGAEFNYLREKRSFRC